MSSSGEVSATTNHCYHQLSLSLSLKSQITIHPSFTKLPHCTNLAPSFSFPLNQDPHTLSAGLRPWHKPVLSVLISHVASDWSK